MIKVALVLFEANSTVVGKTVKFFTNTDYDHAAMMFPEISGDVLFEASGYKGQVLAYRKLSDIKKRNIKILNFEIDNDVAFNWALKKIGTKYDYLGFFLWMLNRQTKGKVYCFEYMANILRFDSKLESYINAIKDGSVSGQDLYKVLMSQKSPIVETKSL